MQNKFSPPLLLICSPSSSPLHCFSYPSSLPPLPTTLSILYLNSPTHSTHTKKNRSCTSCHVRTHIPRNFPLISKLTKQFSWIPLAPFAYKNILKIQAQTHFTLTTQVLHFTLFHYAAQFIRIPLPLPFLTDRVSHLWTVTWFWALPATTTTFSFRLTTLRALIGLVPPHNLSSLAIVSLAAYCSFTVLFSSSFGLANTSLTLRSWFSSSFILRFTALWLSTSQAVKFISLSTGQSTTLLP